MGIIPTEKRAYTLVLNGQELPNEITIEDAIHKFQTFCLESKLYVSR